MEIVQSHDQEESTPEFNFREYWRTIRKRKWVILSVFVVVLTSVAMHTSRLEPVYRATTRIVIDKENPNIVSVNEVMNVDAGSSEYLETQFKILISRYMINRVIDKLDLANSPEFNPPPNENFNVTFSDMADWIVDGMIDTAREGVRLLIPKKPEKPAESVSKLIQPPEIDPEELEKNAELRQRERLYQKVVSRLSVSPIRGSRLVDLSYTGSDPMIITRILNTLTRSYIEQNLESRLYASEDAVEWLDEHLMGMQNKVEASERDLQIYSKNLGVVSLEDSQVTLNQRVSELNSQVIMAKRTRHAKETLYKNSQDPKLADSLPEIINNPLIQNLNQDLAALEAKRSELMEIYGPKYPKIIQIESQIEKVAESIEREIKKIHGSIYTEYQLALAAERSLLQSLEELRNEATFLNEKSIRYGVLKREAASNRQMYDLLLKRLKETDLSLGLRSNNIRVIDEAVPPLGPFKPDKKKNMLMGAVIGLVAGLALAFVIEYLDNTVKEPDEIPLRFGIPFLGLVGSHESSRKDAAKNDSGIGLISCREPSSNISESLRTIRTNVIFSSDGNQQKKFMVTSALPGEGKTTLAGNLAVVMASLGEKVLLIDADLRRPYVHKIFGKAKTPGLSNYLIRQNSLDEVLTDSGLENLTIIPAGISPPNPSELLSHPQMAALLDQAVARYDRVIVDTPPVASVTDPLIVSRQTQAVLLVIRCGVSPRFAVAKAIQQLNNVKAEIMGAVLNAVDFRKDSYYYQYYYKHYYYKEGSKEDDTA